MKAHLVAMCLALILIILLMAPFARAEDFVDDRTWMHAGASAAIGAGIDLGLRQTNLTWSDRLVISTVSCFAVGYSKEAFYDDHISEPDLIWDGIGCLLGASVVEGYTIIATPRGVAIARRF